MSQGHPVVATNNGGQREYIVDGKNGLLVPPGDARKLADAMAKLIDNPDECHQLGLQAKKDFMEHLSYDHLYSQIKELYEHIV